MTDARLAAAVEAAARADFAWRVRDDLRPIVEAALAAADAWDREHYPGRLAQQISISSALTVEEALMILSEWRTIPDDDQEAAQEPQKPPLDGRVGSGGTPGAAMSEAHDPEACATCRAVLYGEGVAPDMRPILGMSPVEHAIRYYTTTPAPTKGYGLLLKHILGQPRDDGPPYVQTFTFPDEDDPEEPA